MINVFLRRKYHCFLAESGIFMCLICGCAPCVGQADEEPIFPPIFVKIENSSGDI